MKIIVGLGNPGSKYEHTRHNAGFLALDHFLKNTDTINCKSTFKSSICEIHFHSTKTFFVKPHTYMNNSGQAVKDICSFYKVDFTKDLLVVHDEKDLLFGTIKTTRSSRAAGHNGVSDIIEQLGSQEFARIRIGIETRHHTDKTPTDAFVLHNFTPQELHILNAEVFPKTDKLIEQFITGNF